MYYSTFPKFGILFKNQVCPKQSILTVSFSAATGKALEPYLYYMDPDEL